MKARGKYTGRFLDEIGDGSGNKFMTVLGSIGTPVEFKCIIPAGEYFDLYRLIIHYEDNAAFSASRFAALGTALPNGITAVWRRVLDQEIISDLLSGLPIKANAHWGRFMFDDKYDDYGTGSANKFLNARWTFNKSGGPIILNEDTEIVFSIRDDLTTLIDFTIFLSGRRGK